MQRMLNIPIDSISSLSIFHKQKGVVREFEKEKTHNSWFSSTPKYNNQIGVLYILASCLLKVRYLRGACHPPCNVSPSIRTSTSTSSFLPDFSTEHPTVNLGHATILASSASDLRLPKGCAYRYCFLSYPGHHFIHFPNRHRQNRKTLRHIFEWHGRC
ncbi:hypothetical protein L207DRAFT_132052 [Hyaloscypha variabilis F]|uniref:Uncharacterized protein n=1 Tax=Hyaloscypha variabilis (strain UAMH 11265 / GT02V1 / F) TaxID=1149755 RepID=A0A2J6R671_HYAVF|nr:hypothetical protein L207DRAFT_132052 [Hyaloscypha variabilis F]